MASQKKDVMSRDGQLPAEFLVDEHGKDLSNEWQLTQPKLWNKLDKLKLLGLCKAANISETEGKKVAELRSALQARNPPLASLATATLTVTCLGMAEPA